MHLLERFFCSFEEKRTFWKYYCVTNCVTNFFEHIINVICFTVRQRIQPSFGCDNFIFVLFERTHSNINLFSSTLLFHA